MNKIKIAVFQGKFINVELIDLSISDPLFETSLIGTEGTFSLSVHTGGNVSFSFESDNDYYYSEAGDCRFNNFQDSAVTIIAGNIKYKIEVMGDLQFVFDDDAVEGIFNEGIEQGISISNDISEVCDICRAGSLNEGFEDGYNTAMEEIQQFVSACVIKHEFEDNSELSQDDNLPF